jgi:hypothetical protein
MKIYNYIAYCIFSLMKFLKDKNNADDGMLFMLLFYFLLTTGFLPIGLVIKFFGKINLPQMLLIEGTYLYLFFKLNQYYFINKGVLKKTEIKYISQSLSEKRLNVIVAIIFLLSSLPLFLLSFNFL